MERVFGRRRGHGRGKVSLVPTASHPTLINNAVLVGRTGVVFLFLGQFATVTNFVNKTGKNEMFVK